MCHRADSQTSQTSANTLLGPLGAGEHRGAGAPLGVTRSGAGQARGQDTRHSSLGAAETSARW